MGTHLYICKKDNLDEEISIPFMRVHLLECHEITTRKDLEHFLEFHRMEWESGLAVRKEHLESMSGQQPKKNYIEFLISHYNWENNVGFNDELKKSDKIGALRQMLKNEIGRHTHFGMTPEVVKLILDKFIEGEHVAHTG